MSWFKRKCRFPPVTGSKGCERDAGHAGGHARWPYHTYSYDMEVWYTCVRCGLPTPRPERVCTHCERFPDLG